MTLPRNVTSPVVEQTQRAPIQVIPLTVPRPLVPEDAQRQTLSDWMLGVLSDHGMSLQPGDVLCISSKIAGLHEGRVVRLDQVTVSRRARWLARALCKDPRKMQLILEAGPVTAVVPMRRIMKKRSGAKAIDRLSTDPRTRKQALDLLERFEVFTSMHAALINEAGIDMMNSPSGHVSQLPESPGLTARRVRLALRDAFGFHVPVIITDTVAPIGRLGTVDVAIGFSGLAPVERKLIAEDLFGGLGPGGGTIVIDSIAAVAGVQMGQTTERTPAVVVRGCDYIAEDLDASEDERCMERLTYPRGTTTPGAILSVLCTLGYYLASLLVGGRRRR